MQLLRNSITRREFRLDSAPEARCRFAMSGRPKGMISYASEDKAFARQLRDGLQSFCDVWFDEDQLKVRLTSGSLLGSILGRIRLNEPLGSHSHC